MNALRHRLPALTRRIPSRGFVSSALRRFPDADAANKGETFSSKARPTSQHPSPELDAGRSYIPPSPTFGAVAKQLADKRSGLGGVEKGKVETFDSPARLRMRYDRPKEARELPDDTSRWKYCELLYTLSSPLCSSSFSLPRFPLFRRPVTLIPFLLPQTSPPQRSPQHYGPSSSST